MKKINLLSITIAVISMFLFPSCEESGCTENNALNYDVFADIDNGACEFSRVSFYSKWGSFNGFPISKIEVFVDNNPVGAVSATYPNGPGNCSAPGNVSYQFVSGEGVEWNANITLINGFMLPSSGGIVSPSRTSDCIKVNVAK